MFGFLELHRALERGVVGVPREICAVGDDPEGRGQELRISGLLGDRQGLQGGLLARGEVEIVQVEAV
jgi:hypothetical protein